MDGDGFRDRRTPRLVGAENDTLNVPIMLADARGQLKEKLSANSYAWAGTGGLSELLFSQFVLAIFLSYVILLTWLRRERPTPQPYGPSGQRSHS